MNRRNYSPYFADTPLTYTVNGIKFRTNTTSFGTPTDLFTSSEEAEIRSQNIGCSGFRKVTVNANGQIQYAPCSTFAEYQNIMKVLEPKQFKRTYYDFDPTENVFDIEASTNDNVYEGFLYKFQIWERTLSNVIFRDPNKILVLESFQKIVYALIETVKQIKNYFNYTVPFNNRRVF
jgi:hypothetical protein